MGACLLCRSCTFNSRVHCGRNMGKSCPSQLRSKANKKEIWLLTWLVLLRYEIVSGSFARKACLHDIIRHHGSNRDSLRRVPRQPECSWRLHEQPGLDRRVSCLFRSRKEGRYFEWAHSHDINSSWHYRMKASLHPTNRNEGNRVDPTSPMSRFSY